MTQETKHTPTPWEYVGGISYGYIHHAKGEITSDVADMSKPDAAFIVRACNAHEELIVLAEKFAEYVHVHEGHSEAFEMICDKIAKASGEA